MRLLGFVSHQLFLKAILEKHKFHTVIFSSSVLQVSMKLALMFKGSEIRFHSQPCWSLQKQRAANEQKMQRETCCLFLYFLLLYDCFVKNQWDKAKAVNKDLGSLTRRHMFASVTKVSLFIVILTFLKNIWFSFWFKQILKQAQ